MVELWQFDWLAAQAVCLKRDMFLADQIIMKAAEGIPEINLRQHLLSEGMNRMLRPVWTWQQSS